MSTATAPPAPALVPSVPLADDERTWPISVALYTRMLNLGLIDEDANVYLWNGRLVESMPPKPPHSNCVKDIYDLLRPLLPPGFDIDRERPMGLTHFPSAPQPDIAVIRGRFRDFPSELFTTAAVCLLVEVADTTLPKDRRNVAVYAAEGVPVYWIANVGDRQIEAYSEPIDGAYTIQAVFTADQEIPVVLEGREVGRLRVADLLP